MDKRKIYLYGAGKIGRIAIQQLKDQYVDTTIVEGILDRYKTGEIEGVSIKNAWGVKCDKESDIVITIGDFRTAASINEELRKAGYTKIWWYIGNRKKITGDFIYEQCMSCQAWRGEMLLMVEMHIMDACNLNCRGCSHFSPLFKKKWERAEPDFQEKIKDVKKIAEKFDHIVKFTILGGEPLLNSAVGEYVVEIRKILPDTEIYMFTNGLLIPEMDSHILRKLGDNRICILISEYEVTHRRIKEITERLDGQNILYEICPVQKFYRPLTIAKNTKHKQFCISDKCTIIGNGKIARCPMLMYIDKFNEYFGQNLPNEGILSLDTPLEGDKLIEYLRKKIPLCKHCILEKIDWSICEKTPKLEDFAAID